MSEWYIEEFKMRRSQVIVMMCLCFTLGTLLGLMVQIPGVSFDSQDDPDGNHHQSSLNIERRSLKEVNIQHVDYSISLHADKPIQAEQNDPDDDLRRPIFVPLDMSELSKNSAHYNTQNMESITGTNHLNRLNPGPNHASQLSSGSSTMNQDFTDIRNIVNGIYWTPTLENLVPGGFQHDNNKKWKKFVHDAKIVHMQEGCGRMQNRKIMFHDASLACARYRINTDQLQGEVYSYYLSRVLGIHNIPPVAILKVNLRDKAWENVNGDIASAQWGDGRVVILSQWVPDLTPAFIPENFRKDTRFLAPTKDYLINKTVHQLIELVQWSDLIIFDYLTANLDRVVNNMFNEQWNRNIMESPAHNLEKSTVSNTLVFLDNESGLFHSYRLLEKYAHFHDKLLKSLCIFKKSTADRIAELVKTGDTAKKVWKQFIQEEPLHENIPKIPEKNAKILQQRIRNVYRQIQRCKAKFGEGKS